ncbi:hypothetical protein H4W31_006413 [Plantactinospora soyae]|uniref:Uncharacterized protein n=1 Tax=Plantactinospora soyae TaxID=1544732 RepID=A0A927MBX5_9ACTN|nr:hypothetical protein [Plantactinospora soyae]
MDFDKLAVRYQATVHLLAINEWFHHHFTPISAAHACGTRQRLDAEFS